MKLRIESLKLHEVGPFSDTTIHFAKRKDAGAEVHILTGPNGSGKSTVLASMSLPFIPIEGTVRDFRQRMKSKFSQIEIETNLGLIGFIPDHKKVHRAHQFGDGEHAVFFSTKLPETLSDYFMALQAKYVRDVPILTLSFSGH